MIAENRFHIVQLSSDQWVVVEGTETRSRVVASCVTAEDAERVRAALVGAAGDTDARELVLTCVNVDEAQECAEMLEEQGFTGWVEGNHLFVGFDRDAGPAGLLAVASAVAEDGRVPESEVARVVADALRSFAVTA